ncbi:MAG: serine/threonine-protein kinase [Holophagales bacterium]|nr:serine/threonine-protein kinase [Holophagales bacterium]
MTPEDWQRLDSLAQAAFDLPPEQRAAFVASAGIDRPELHQALASLLDADARADDFLETPAHPPADRRRPRVGDRLGPYRLLEEIGYGSWSRVYRAARDDPGFEQQVAIKVVDPGLGSGGVTGGAIAQRFRVERQILARLEHPSIARLLDGGEAEGYPYFVLEYVDGRPIDRYCAERGLGVAARLRLMLRALDAVAYAHERLIVHRDLKPANLLITRDGTPKLLDFGIAKVLEPSVLPLSVEATRSGLRPMTPAWAAPEQVRGGAVTTATDVYTLGLLLYRLLVGERAYRIADLSPGEMERSICDQAPLLLSRRLEQDPQPREPSGRPPDGTPARLRGDLDAIVAKALEKDPARRYRTVRQLAEDLERHLAGETVSARPATWVYRASSWLRRYRLAAAAAVAALLGVAIFVALLLAQSARLETERDLAQLESRRAEEVSAFLVEIFAEVDPGRRRGRDPVRRLLDQGLAHIERLRDPALRAELLLTLGEVHSGLGEVEESIHLLQRAHREAVSLYGEAHPESAEALHRLAAVCLDWNRFEQADQALRRALELRRRTLGEDHPDTAKSLALLGRLRYLQGFWDESESLLDQAIRRLEHTRSPGHEVVLEFLADRARALARRGRAEEAISLLERRLELALELGERHPMVPETMRILAWSVRDPEAAMARFEEARALQESILGPEHPQTARLYHAMAARAVEVDPEQARELALRALEIDRRVWGDGSWSLSLDHNVLARASRLLGDPEAASRHWRAAADNARRGSPATHPWRIRVLMGWSTELLIEGRGAEATPLLEEVRELQAGLPHPEPRWQALSEAMAALADHQQGDATAVQRLRRHADAARHLFGEGSRLYQRFREALGEPGELSG